MPLISVVVPVYNSEDCLVELTKRLHKSLKKITSDYEIIYVEDGGGDRSWEMIMRESQIDKRIKGIHFCRNFGQHHALTAGLDYAKGDWIVAMDCDLQDSPEEIETLYNNAIKGYDVVLAQRTRQGDSKLKRDLSKLFYKVFDYLAGTTTDPTVGTFRIFSQKVNQTFRSMREEQRFFGGMFQWMGFRTHSIDIPSSARYSGKSSYNFRKRLNLSMTAIISFSNKPLILSVKLGFLICLFSVLYSCRLIYRKLVYDIPVEGWTSVIVSLYLIGGLIIMNSGIIGIYIGRIYDQTKNRPIYIIDETTFDE